MEIIYILGFLAAGQGLFLLFMLLKNNKTKSLSQYLLLALLFIISLGVLEYSLVWSGDIRHIPHLIGFTTCFQFLFCPLIYLFLKGGDKISTRSFEIMHWAPFAIILVYMMPHLLVSADLKLENFLSIYLVQVDLRVIHAPMCLFFVLQSIIYYILIRKLASKNIAIYGKTIYKIFFVYTVVHIGHTSLMYFLPEYLPTIAIAILLSSIACVYLLSYYMYNREKVIKEEQANKYAYSKLSNHEAKEIVSSLEALIVMDNYFTDSDIRINIVAKKLEIPVQKLSQSINQIKKMSFRNFINNYRVEFAIREIDKRALDGISLKELAYDSGFNNKTSFANAFKKIKHMNPSDYLKVIRTQRLL